MIYGKINSRLGALAQQQQLAQQSILGQAMFITGNCETYLYCGHPDTNISIACFLL